MYSETTHSDNQSHSIFDRYFDSVHHPATLKITTEDLNVSVVDRSDVSLDDEQKISANLSPPRPSTRVTESQSAPFALSSHVSSSPAAMFLSAFSSPSTAPAVPPDSEGQVVASYTLGPIIGYGGFSTIRRASSGSGGIVAVKIVRNSDLSKQGNASVARKRLHHEAAVWASLSHQHILPLFSTEHTPYADYFFTLLCPAGSLFDILKRDGALPQDDAGMVLRQVVRGLRYLHENAQIVHRDIKLENVLVDEMGVCRISDFGMARRIGELDEDEDKDDPPQELRGMHRTASVSVAATSRKPQSNLGTHHPSLIRHHGPRHRNSTTTATHAEPTYVFEPGSLPYASPELLMPHTSHGPEPAQDIWALGVLLYALLMGKLPFTDSFEPRLQMKILHGSYDVPPGIGRGAERVLAGCLDRIVSSRWTIAMVDEVAWGVGWGSECDDVQPASPVSAKVDRSQSRPPMRQARSRPADIEIPQVASPAEESMSAASRRSLSRANRSLSRAPVLTDRSSSARSISRHRQQSPSPTFSSALTNSVRSIKSTSTSSSASSMERERGRRGRGRQLHLRSPSRSASPSVVPRTPIDLAVASYPSAISREESIEGGEKREHSRGRRKFVDLKAPSGLPRSESYYGLTSDGLDVLDESTRWSPTERVDPSASSGAIDGLPSSAIPNRPSFLSSAHGSQNLIGEGSARLLSSSVNDIFVRDGNQMKRRAGSTPPGPLSPSPEMYSFAREGGLSVSGTVPIPIKGSNRSRSMGYGLGGGEREL